jgi:hypothetical protein
VLRLIKQLQLVNLLDLQNKICKLFILRTNIFCNIYSTLNSSKRTSTYQNLASRVSEATQWRNLKPKSSPAHHDGLKFERIRVY